MMMVVFLTAQFFQHLVVTGDISFGHVAQDCADRVINDVYYCASGWGEGEQ